VSFGASYSHLAAADDDGEASADMNDEEAAGKDDTGIASVLVPELG